MHEGLLYHPSVRIQLLWNLGLQSHRKTKKGQEQNDLRHPPEYFRGSSIQRPNGEAQVFPARPHELLLLVAILKRQKTFIVPITSHITVHPKLLEVI